MVPFFSPVAHRLSVDRAGDLEHSRPKVHRRDQNDTEGLHRFPGQLRHLGRTALAIVVFAGWAGTLAAPPAATESIDTGDCTASCHLEFSKKPVVHKAARRGTSCKNCHKPVEAGRHVFKPMPAVKSELCLDCHDEMEPKGKQLHKPFKAGNCTKCHDPHQSEHAKLLRKPAGRLCLGCHDEQEATKKHLHKPFKAGNCVKCHDPHQSDEAKQLKQPVNKLCLGCHDDQVANQKHTHKPFKAGNCVKCHDPHQADQAKQLKKPLPQLCMGCHDEDEFKGKSVHGPVAEGKCLQCHHPHQSDNARLLQKLPPELCLGCHAKPLKDAQGLSLPPLKRLLEDKEALHHPPFAEGKCVKCHQPHVSAIRRLLARAYPPDFYATYAAEAYALCFECHDKKAFAEPRTLADTRFRNGNLNLHHRHVNREKGRSCGACHTPHGSVQEKLIHPDFVFGRQNLGLKYEKTETGGSCATACHGPIKYDRCKPEIITLRTTPRLGSDAGVEELAGACEKQKQAPRKPPAKEQEKAGEKQKP